MEKAVEINIIDMLDEEYKNNDCVFIVECFLKGLDKMINSEEEFLMQTSFLISGKYNRKDHIKNNKLK